MSVCGFYGLWFGGSESGHRILTALPVGYVADKYGRSPTVKVGGVGTLLWVVKLNMERR